MFRKEVITARKQKLHGNVFLVQPLSFSFYIYLLLSIVLLSSFFLVKGSYARAEKVVGQLVPSKGLVKLNAPYSSLLESLDVEEGERVKKGQQLATLSVAINTINGKSVEELEYRSLQEQQNEIDMQINLEINQLEAEKAQVSAEMEGFEQELKSLRARLEFQKALTKSSKLNLKSFEKLFNSKFISHRDYQRSRQEWLRDLTGEKIIQQDIDNLGSKVTLKNIRLSQLPYEAKQRVGRLKAQYLEFEGRKATISGRNKFIIKAPMDGVILSLGAISPGTSIAASQFMLAIYPDDSVLEVVLFVPSKAVGFIQPGQETRILFDAYPYQYYGSQKAVITNIAGSAHLATELTSSYLSREPVYRIKARLEKNYIEARGRVLSLQAGMMLKANIVLERRNVFEWILEPVRAVGKRT